MSRFFNRNQHNDLFLRSDGYCSNCGARLNDGWHADHVQPYSAGGITTITNGEALCPECNMQKGAKVRLRKFQAEFKSVALQRLFEGERHIVVEAAPGSGKTIGALEVANTLLASRIVDGVAIYVPRLNLADQFGSDFITFSSGRRNAFLTRSKFGIAHRENNAPLINNDLIGFVSTYQSLAAALKIHRLEFQQRRMLLICDEAHQLGVDEDLGTATKSADCIRELYDAAAFTILMTGTPIRGGTNRYILSKDLYRQHDSGEWFLDSHVKTNYVDGVAQGYLRQFEAAFVDAIGQWRDFARETSEALSLETAEAGLYRFLQDEQYWSRLVDLTVENLDLQRTQYALDKRMCALIATYDQRQAKDVETYIRRQYPHLKALVAVSDDGNDAKNNLRLFREGKYDVLITVNMAYMGYDHKPISVVCLLTKARTPSYLMQLVARGLRVMPDLEYQKQRCIIIAPNDYRMRQFVDDMRLQSERGLADRELRERQEFEMTERDTQAPLGYMESMNVTGVWGMTNDPIGDLDPQKHALISGFVRRENVPMPEASFAAVIEKFNREMAQAAKPQFASAQVSKPIDYNALISDKKRDIKLLVIELVKATGRDHEYVNTVIKSKFKKSRGDLLDHELEACIQFCKHWLRTGSPL